ncbi:MAG: sugar transferase, partial [Proteobacteria bacterium]|nr:sugar transferase [Pseudomonadota bacterium]
TTNPFFLPLVLVATGAWHGRRVVPLVYDLYPDAWEATGVTKASSPASRLAVRANELLFRHADAVVFIGDNMARHAISRYGEPRRWTVIQTGADRAEFDRAEARIASRGWEHDGWLRSRVLITYTGNLGRVHDWTALAVGLKAAFVESDLGRKAACLIAASGPGAEFLRKELGDVDDDAIRFSAPLEDEPWAEALARSSISLVALGEKAAATSIPSKTFSAMAAGNALVVVTPKGSDLHDLVKRHDCGIVVAPGDGAGVAAAVKKLVRETELRKRLASNGLAAAREHYEMEVLAGKWREFMAQVEKERPARIGYEAAKRLVDLTASSVALLAAAPALVPLAAAIRLTMGKPVFFRQARAGKKGVAFDLLKFRSMKLNRLSVAEMGVIKQDHPMVTPLGRILRRFKIDELPQLLNVLKGDMSLVGPRPTVPEQAEEYTEFQRRRLNVRPGMTGWAQINGNTSLSWGDRIRLDVWYVDNWSLGLDLRILLETMATVVRGERVNEKRLEEAKRHESDLGRSGR